MISVLIVNWNTRDLLRACLASLRAALAGLEHEIIVVDNASRDGSAAMVRAEFPEVALIDSKENLGFAAGNNRALAAARGEWIWLLNPDTEVEIGAAQKLIAFIEQHSQCGAVASALIDARSGKPQQSCRTFPTPAALWVEALGLARAFPRSKTFGFYRMGWWNMRQERRVEQPMASSFLLRRAAIDSISESTPEVRRTFFDENFPILFNDVDLCWRLHRADWEIWYVPQARVKHWGGASTAQVKPAMIRESHRGLARFYDKHWRGKIAAPLYLITLTMMHLAGAARYLAARRRERNKRGHSDE